jgi:hypothetical protein
MLRRSFLALCLATSPALAQTADRDLPQGKELIVVYVGATSCGPCLLPETKSAVARMKVLLASFAEKNGYAFSAVGVATDWSTASGVKFLSDNAPFDQLVIGGNWTNLAVEHYIWRDSTATPAMPQVVVLERSVTIGDRIDISPARVLRRVFGSDELPKWVEAGAPVTLAPGSAPARR